MIISTAIRMAIRSKRPGPKPILTEDMESDLQSWIVGMQTQGYPISWHMLLVKANEIYREMYGCTRSVGSLTTSWIQRFLSKHLMLCLRVSQVIKRARAEVNVNGIQGFFDYEEAVAYAKKVNKPIFIDFTGHGCVNCRKMEENVWSNPEVLKRLKEDYVVVALYVDDKTELPQSQWFTSSYDGKVKSSMLKFLVILLSVLQSNYLNSYLLLLRSY